MTTSPSSSVQQARQALADRLREIRQDSGLTAREVARVCGWHESKSSRLEHARTAPSPADIRAWCAACGAEDQTEDLIASLRVLTTMYVEWRRLLKSGLKRQQETRLPLYERTRRFRVYSSWLIPGLLQTRAFTATVLRSIMERDGLPDDVDEAIAARMRRQEVLHKGDHRFAFVIEETALRNTVCSADVMVGQLNHLIMCSSLPSVSLGVIPLGSGRERWPTENFWIFDDAQVNVELVASYLTVTQSREIAEYVRTFEAMSRMALVGRAARDLIRNVISSS
ncbi:helix-turn-helix transcriptional regulator [Actinomadura fulvescens]|uniref:Helix-turn-helix transcriptional regulator n=1 Tax=Actinomadura fulvescens TaxID=46160 RepID=A0ABN3QYM8_9ACTN